MAKIPNKLLSRLLLSAVPPYNSSKESKNDVLKIKEISVVGDVQHVFSHIKKTYRTQWVILEGGERPPPLRQGKPEENLNAEEPMHGDDDGPPSSLSSSMWTKLEDVSNAKYVASLIR